MPQTFVNKVYWYDMLTRDHTVCRICHTQPHERDKEPTLRSMPYHYFDGIGPRSASGNERAWKRAAKATIRAHIRDTHPEWDLDNIRWTGN